MSRHLGVVSAQSSSSVSRVPSHRALVRRMRRRHPSHESQGPPAKATSPRAIGASVVSRPQSAAPTAQRPCANSVEPACPVSGVRGQPTQVEGRDTQTTSTRGARATRGAIATRCARTQSRARARSCLRLVPLVRRVRPCNFPRPGCGCRPPDWCVRCAFSGGLLRLVPPARRRQPRLLQAETVGPPRLELQPRRRRSRGRSMSLMNRRSPSAPPEVESFRLAPAWFASSSLAFLWPLLDATSVSNGGVRERPQERKA